MSGVVRNFSKSRVLIADNSPLVLSNLKLVLREMGFSARLIVSAKDVRTMLTMARTQQVDVVICDYNFCSQINGKQILDEFRAEKLLPPHGAFVMLSGETQPSAVRTILESEPDEYVLKPYSGFELKRRLANVCARKQDLAYLSELDSEMPIEDVEQVFESALKQTPEYEKSILRLRGDYYIKNQHFEFALDLYKKCLRRNASHWAILGAVDALLALGQPKKAEHYLNQWVEKRDGTTPRVMEAYARIYLKQKRIDDAHLQLSKSLALTHNNADRIAGRAILNEALGLFERAFVDRLLHAKLVRYTFRDVLAVQLDVFRMKIQMSTSNHSLKTQEIRNDLYQMSKRINDDNKLLALSIVDCHLEIVDNNPKVARIKLNNLLKNYTELDLDSSWYLLYLLYITHNHQWFNRIFQHVKMHLPESTDSNLMSLCCRAKFDFIAQWQRKKHRQQQKVLLSIDEAKESDIERALNVAMNFFKARPLSAHAAVALIDLIGRALPRNLEAEQVRDLIFNCEGLIAYSASLTAQERQIGLEAAKRAKHRFNTELSCAT
ncbi:response regulator [Vibrio paucivorans]